MNDSAEPSFAWTATADSIFAKLLFAMFAAEERGLLGSLRGIPAMWCFTRFHPGYR